MNYDDLLVIKHTLEDAIGHRLGMLNGRVNERGWYREPVADMQRVLEKLRVELADIDANERGLLEIEAGYENGAN